MLVNFFFNQKNWLEVEAQEDRTVRGKRKKQVCKPMSKRL